MVRATVNPFAEHKREKDEFQAFSQAERKTEKKKKKLKQISNCWSKGTQKKAACCEEMLMRDADC